MLDLRWAKTLASMKQTYEQIRNSKPLSDTSWSGMPCSWKIGRQHFSYTVVGSLSVRARRCSTRRVQPSSPANTYSRYSCILHARSMWKL